MEKENCFVTTTGRMIVTESLAQDLLSFWFTPILSKSSMQPPKAIVRNNFNERIARRRAEGAEISKKTCFAKIYADLGHPSSVGVKRRDSESKNITFLEIYTVLGRPRRK